MSKVINLTDKTFEQEVLKSDKYVLVDFWAPWCGPCRMMAPVLDELSEEMADKLKVAKLDTEVPDHQGLAIEYHIHSIPNMKLFRDGQVVHDFIGFRPKEIFKQELEEVIK